MTQKLQQGTKPVTGTAKIAKVFLILLLVAKIFINDKSVLIIHGVVNLIPCNPRRKGRRLEFLHGASPST